MPVTSVTPAGTLLITWVDPSGRVKGLRQRLREVFPGACSRQASIIHTSLMRILSSEEQLDRDAIAAVGRVCKQWTQRLRGRSFVPGCAWWIYENPFSANVGDKTNLAFASQGT